jgi:hypothetical protein
MLVSLFGWFLTRRGVVLLAAPREHLELLAEG